VVARVHAPESEGNLECWAHEDSLTEIITRKETVKCHWAWDRRLETIDHCAEEVAAVTARVDAEGKGDLKRWALSHPTIRRSRSR